MKKLLIVVSLLFFGDFAYAQDFGSDLIARPSHLWQLEKSEDFLIIFTKDHETFNIELKTSTSDKVFKIPAENIYKALERLQDEN